MKITKHNRKCFQSHFGRWMMEPDQFYALYNLIMSEKIEFDVNSIDADKHDPDEDEQRRDDMALTTMTAGGIMIVPIEGAIMRGVSSFGGTSSVQIRRVIRIAARNPEVKGILFRVDSPGGTVAGTDELVDDIRAVAQIKPIRSHVEGLGASAAVWIMSPSEVITASRTSEVGSLGTVAVVHDMSEMAKNDGIKVHVISTGDFKGAFTPGAEVTEEQLADLQSIVNDLNEFFMEAVQNGRGLDAKTVKKLFDGRVHVADTALKLGLIDGVMSFEQAIRSFERDVFVEDDGSDSALARARAITTIDNI